MICECGHSKKTHTPKYWINNKYWTDDYYLPDACYVIMDKKHPEGTWCPCKKFRHDNLKYLEELADKEEV